MARVIDVSWLKHSVTIVKLTSDLEFCICICSGEPCYVIYAQSNNFPNKQIIVHPFEMRWTLKKMRKSKNRAKNLEKIAFVVNAKRVYDGRKESPCGVWNVHSTQNCGSVAIKFKLEWKQDENWIMHNRSFGTFIIDTMIRVEWFE